MLPLLLLGHVILDFALLLMQWLDPLLLESLVTEQGASVRLEESADEPLTETLSVLNRIDAASEGGASCERVGSGGRVS